jgi:hypothetical protein
VGDTYCGNYVNLVLWWLVEEAKIDVPLQFFRINKLQELMGTYRCGSTSYNELPPLFVAKANRYFKKNEKGLSKQAEETYGLKYDYPEFIEYLKDQTDLKTKDYFDPLPIKRELEEKMAAWALSKEKLAQIRDINNTNIRNHMGVSRRVYNMYRLGVDVPPAFSDPLGLTFFLFNNDKYDRHWIRNPLTKVRAIRYIRKSGVAKRAIEAEWVQWEGRDDHAFEYLWEKYFGTLNEGQ